MNERVLRLSQACQIRRHASVLLDTFNTPKLIKSFVNAIEAS
jgi:hypothetical protein